MLSSSLTASQLYTPTTVGKVAHSQTNAQWERDYMTKTVAKLELENERLKARLSNNTLDSQNQQLAEQRDELIEENKRM